MADSPLAPADDWYRLQRITNRQFIDVAFKEHYIESSIFVSLTKVKTNHEKEEQHSKPDKIRRRGGEGGAVATGGWSRPILQPLYLVSNPTTVADSPLDLAHDWYRLQRITKRQFIDVAFKEHYIESSISVSLTKVKTNHEQEEQHSKPGREADEREGRGVSIGNQRNWLLCFVILLFVQRFSRFGRNLLNQWAIY